MCFVMGMKGTLTPVLPRIARNRLVSSRANKGLIPTFSEWKVLIALPWEIVEAR
jgi:hypothetical protein